jgi:hypothetical protein
MLKTNGTNRKFYYSEHLEDYENKNKEVKEVKANLANLASSLCEDGMHRPALDLDLPAEIFQSSTPGHCHLYIDKPMTWAVYARLLVALEDAGLLEEKYVNYSLERKSTMLRLPHIRKEKE